MARETDIEWPDSTCNGQMGCDGCELRDLKRGIRKCYAGAIIDRYAGKNSGFPMAFEKPEIYPHRLKDACRWSDLTGTDRELKPWLNGRPRMIFLDDMGDTFTESLPLDWLQPHLSMMGEVPHQWMTLTKRPHRMLQFAKQCGWPANFWPGTSITSAANLGRANPLQAMKEEFGGTTFVSVEPLWSEVSLKKHLPYLDLVILGGESGPSAEPCDIDWLRRIIGECAEAGVRCFVKQLGSKPVVGPLAMKLESAKGGKMHEWPADLRIRQFPGVTTSKPAEADFLAGEHTMEARLAAEGSCQ